MESTVSESPPPDALAKANALTSEYPPTVVVAVNALAPSASLPLLTTYSKMTIFPSVGFLPVTPSPK